MGISRLRTSYALLCLQGPHLAEKKSLVLISCSSHPEEVDSFVSQFKGSESIRREREIMTA